MVLMIITRDDQYNFATSVAQELEKLKMNILSHLKRLKIYLANMYSILMNFI